MLSTFDEFTPYVFVLTIIVSGILGCGWQKKDLHHNDSIAALFCFALGLIITTINFVYSNHYLITIGPALTIISASYLRYRPHLICFEIDSIPTVSQKSRKIIRILYWVFLTCALLANYFSEVYFRNPIFFIFIALCVGLLGLEALTQKREGKLITITIICKILLTSLILRGSAYYISPYPVGADPWAHAEYIKNFVYFGHLQVLPYPPGTGISDYYIQYPIMHIFGALTDLICHLSVKDSMFIVGVILTLSTIFVYLIATTAVNTKFALFSLLILNFSDFHIQWSIEIIAMTFGIALYTFLLYIISKMNITNAIIYKIIFIFLSFLIVWTHTVTTFITLISIVVLAVASTVYPYFYNERKTEIEILSIYFIIILAIFIFLKWFDPSVPFFEGVSTGLQSSVSSGVEVLGRTSPAYANEKNIKQIFDIIGILSYIIFGALGCLCYLSQKFSNKVNFSYICIIGTLFFFFFSFPLMGMRNIVPYRWPAFIYITLSMFVCIGYAHAARMIRNVPLRNVALLLIIFITSFFMITNFVSNTDSPIYNAETTNELFLRASEVCLLTDIRDYSEKKILTDSTTIRGPLTTYLRDWNCEGISITNTEDIDWDDVNNVLIVWRRSTIIRPPLSAEAPFGSRFKADLEREGNGIFSTGESKIYFFLKKVFLR